MTRTDRRLQKVYDRSKIIRFDQNSKFVIMSDCHRGQGNNSDNFLQNQHLFFGALEHYYNGGFTYIELGDGDELWENRDMAQIIDAHSDAFWLMSRFYGDKRFYMIYGNHDVVKNRRSFAKKYCYKYYCEAENCCMPLFPGMQIYEGLILENPDGKRIFLTHGHQASFLNDTLWPLARFLVRYLWRPLELVGFLAPTGSGRPSAKKEKIEQKLAGFANDNREIMIAGHTHRPVFPMPKEGFYFNDGSCVHPRCITALEIENGAITLVKWCVATKEDRTLFVDRQVLEGPVPIAQYV